MLSNFRSTGNRNLFWHCWWQPRMRCYIQGASRFLLFNSIWWRWSVSNSGNHLLIHFNAQTVRVNYLLEGNSSLLGIICCIRKVFRQVLNISRAGDTTTSLSSLFQYSVTLTVGKFYYMFVWNFCVSIQAHCLLSCHWTLPKRARSHPLDTCLQIFISIDEISPSVVFSRLNSPGSLSWSSYRRITAVSVPPLDSE